MHAFIAAIGTANKQFDAHVGAASEPMRELTSPDAMVRLAVAMPRGVVASARRDARSVAALGSVVQLVGPDIAEQLLDRYERDPLGILDGLPDDIVVVVADEDAGTLTVGAGRGNHRIFAKELDDGALLSTHLATLAAALGPELEVAREYEDFYCGFGFFPDGQAVYRGVTTCSPGQVRTLPEGATRAIEGVEVDYVDLDLNDPASVSRALHDAFFTALEEQAGDRRRHAVLLGGFDSALVAAGLRRLGHDVDCYTFGFGDAEYEQRNVQLVTDTIGAAQSWVQFTPELIGDLLEHFDESFNQPGPQPHYQLHTLHASRVIAADGHTHVFSGDGCDAAFLGYPMVNQRARAVARLASLPAPVLHAATNVLGRPFVERHLGHVARLGRSLLGNLALPEPARGHLPTRYLDDIALARLRVDSAPPQAETVDETRLRLAVAVRGLDATRRAFHGNGLTGQSKAKVEGAVADTGVAQFSPFLHPAVKGLANALPLEALRPAGTSAGSPGKAVLVAMAREYNLLPDAVIEMPKQSPVDAPIDHWYAGPLRPLVDELLAGLPFAVNRRYIDEVLAPKRAEEVFRRRVSLGHHATQVIGVLCSYATFTRRAH